jgi:Response regulators consisting of a CheY-like receiver domain and a winged-helix DNA-binding domain
MKRTILVIEDIEEMSKLIILFLRDAGYTCIGVETAEDALVWLNGNACDLIILDLNLPGMSGFDFLNKVRRFSNVPILIASARQTPEDLITGLGFGADDYLPKPFDPRVLLARTRAILRRSELAVPAPVEIVVNFGPFSFDRKMFLLEKGTDRIPISMREFGILDFLIANADIPKTPQAIYDAVWKNKYGDLTTVAVYIQRLRRKLENDPSKPVYICTEFGKGYYFHNPDHEGQNNEN